MQTKNRLGWKWLQRLAADVAEQLRPRSMGTSLRIRYPRWGTITNTDGWTFVIGDLGKGKPKLEIWFDRFSGHPERKLCACFASSDPSQIAAISKRVAKKLYAVRIIRDFDLANGKYLYLDIPLKKSEFNHPVFEKYTEGESYFGIFDSTKVNQEHECPTFCANAVAFFEDVARSMPHASEIDEQREVYPRSENRKKVQSHVRRERSPYLATQCKIRDNYTCQVCRFEFRKKYGDLGIAFAEAHHRVPLSKLKESVKTRLEDLTTVCANCHRMLHKMEGEKNDIDKLRKIILKPGSKKK